MIVFLIMWNCCCFLLELILFVVVESCLILLLCFVALSELVEQMGHSVQLGFCLLVMGFDCGLLAYDLPRLQGLSAENLLAGLIDVESFQVEHAV